MAIPITAIQKRRIITQIENNLVNLQRDMHRNAETHKAMAQAKSPDLAMLQKFVADCASRYMGRLQWVIDLRNDNVKRQRLVDMLESAGWTEQEIIDLVVALRDAAVALRDAPRNNYAQIESACDAMIAAVEMPPSLWPE